MSDCIGSLNHHDSLHGYFAYEILPAYGRTVYFPVFDVYKLKGSHAIYLYREKKSGIKLIAKFFGSDDNCDYNTKLKRLEREYDNLVVMRSMGFDKFPHLIVRPLGKNSSLNQVLVEEYIEGKTLAHYIKETIYARDGRKLYKKLTSLAYFLASIHNASAGHYRVNFNWSCDYIMKILYTLRHKCAISHEEMSVFQHKIDKWRGQEIMYSDVDVLVHGDATPTNFIFQKFPRVAAIDFERLKRADRVFDIGRITAELKHFFLQYTGNKFAAEPFIGHFLWEYCCHFPDRHSAFLSISARLPFYMAATELRIARNDWISWDYRKKLINEAKECLKL